MFGITTGQNVPTSKYDQSIISYFPRTQQKYLVEAGISSRNFRDYLPTNANYYSGNVKDSFIEFNISGVDNEFIDLGTLASEISIKILKEDGVTAVDTDKITLTDGFFHRIFQSVSVYLNGVQVENSPHFGLMNVVKTYLNMSRDKLLTFGENMGYKETDVDQDLSDSFFTNSNSREKALTRKCKEATIHMFGPINLDIGDVSTYLLDKIDLRIRFDLAPASILIKSTDAASFKYKVESCKLWVERLLPIPSAMIALNKVMSESMHTVDYMFNRQLLKTVIMPKNQTSLMIDNIFQGVIPHKLVIFVMDQKALNGEHKKNSSYFIDNKISQIKVEVNGTDLSNIVCSFPDKIAQVFYETIRNVGTDQPSLLTYENFCRGKTIFCFDTRSSNASDVIYIEKGGLLRITIMCDQPTVDNRVVFIVGHTTGMIETNIDRRIFTNYLQ